jgi:putative tricarboxylic transport membrane protein
MRLNDAVSGALIAILGIAVVAYSRTFPSMLSQSVGPALFPTIIGVGFIALGAVMVMTGRRTKTPLVAFDAWVRSRAAALKFLLVIGALVFYVSVLNVLGFFLTAFVLLTGLCLAFGVRRRLILPLSIAAILAIHYAFYSLLRVPLPWGVLERMAW